MSADIDFDIAPVRVLTVPATAGDQLLITGDCALMGYSLRDATHDVPAQKYGTVTSPGASANIVQITGLPAGTYLINWQVELSGTLAAADANNFELTSSSGAAFQSENPGAAGVYPQPQAEITVGTGGTLQIIAIAAGTTGAVYSAQLSLLVPVSGNSLIELQDGNNALAEISLGPGDSESRWFGGDGVHVRGQINLHFIQGAAAGAVYARYYDSTG